MEYFKFLPEEIVLDILSRVVPTESCLDCKSVCKTWRNIISYHPSFSKMHLNHLNRDDSAGMLGFTVITDNNILYYFEYNDDDKKNHDQIERMIRKINANTPSLDTDKRIIGSCNGLICLAEEEKIYVCNPITREYIRLPEIKTDCNTNDVCWSRGFGYVSSTNEYKVVQIMLNPIEFVQVHIYTLGSGNGWRNLGNFFNFGSFEDWDEGISSNGVLYCLLNGLVSDTHKIVAFDLAEEKFCDHISLPPLPYICNYKIGGVLDGFLFLAVGRVIQGVVRYEIWILRKQKEQQSWVWRKELMVENSKLFSATKTGDVLTYSKNFINIVDPKASTSKTLVDLKRRICQVFPHKNTFVSLKELGEEDAKIMEPIDVKETETNL